MPRYRADDGLQALTGMDPRNEVGPLISVFVEFLTKVSDFVKRGSVAPY